MTARSLRLEFGEEVSSVIRARMAYAFRVFAAVYGYEVVDEERPDTLRCLYGRRRKGPGPSATLHIPARYVWRRGEHWASPPAPTAYAYEELSLFHGRDADSGDPDWLGEIFEWLSSADERAISHRDPLGRIPYARTLFGRHAISPRRAHASLIMAWLQHALTGGKGSEALPAAPSPVPGVNHLVMCSHDVDFYFVGRRGTLTRLVKNLGIALLVTRSPRFFRDTLGQLLRLARGQRVGDFVPRLLAAGHQHDFVSTFFVIARRQHPRDANYMLPEIAPRLRQVLTHGCQLALHGSYRSIVENCDLKSEVGALAAVTGQMPRGNRQHWLRFDSHERLFGQVEEAGLAYDSSLGFSDTVGFRNGAAFAFPPYNFEREEPYDFLEIPLAVMDSALVSASRSSLEQAATLTATVLEESRRRGWGGIAVLWHNPLEPLGVPEGINRIFWNQLKSRAQNGERWISAEQFLALSLPRYHQAGLLKGVGAVAHAASR